MQKLVVERSNDTAIVRLSGRLDAAAAEAIKGDLRQIDEFRLLLDMSAVDFVDSSGLGLIVSVFRRKQEQEGRLAIFGLSAQVRAIFELTRLHKILDIYSTESQALEAD